MSVVRRLEEPAQAIPLRARSLTDLQLKALKPRDKAYKVSDRDGLYAYVPPSGTVEYGMGLSLAEARLLLIKAKRSLEQGSRRVRASGPHHCTSTA